MCKCYPQIHEDAASIKNEQLERSYGNRKKKNWQKIFKKENWQSKEIDLLNWSSILPNFFSLSFFYLEESIQIVFWIKQRKWKVKVKVTQSCLTLCDPMEPARFLCPWDSQARILEWVAFPFSRGASQSRDRTQVSFIAGWFFTCWATREAQGKHNWRNNIRKLPRNEQIGLKGCNEG